MAAIAPTIQHTVQHTVQKVTHEIREIVKSFLQARKSKNPEFEDIEDIQKEPSPSEGLSEMVSSAVEVKTSPAFRKAQTRKGPKKKASSKSLAARSQSTRSHKSKAKPAKKIGKKKIHMKARSTKASSKPKTSEKSRKKPNRDSMPTPTGNVQKSASSDSTVIPNQERDLAHMPGHRKMNLKSQFTESTGRKAKDQNPSSMNFASGSDRVQRVTSKQRRIIGGSGTLGSKSFQSRSRKAQ